MQPTRSSVYRGRGAVAAAALSSAALLVFSSGLVGAQSLQWLGQTFDGSSVTISTLTSVRLRCPRAPR